MDGYLATVPRFEHLKSAISDKRARECYNSIYETVADLGRAMQLGQHRPLIENLNETLTDNTLEAIAIAASKDQEVCSAFSVYLTTLEQAYAWPRRDVVSTPRALSNHKLVVQMLYHESLTKITYTQSNFLLTKFPGSQRLSDLVLATATQLLAEAEEARQKGSPLLQEKQDLVNLLYRTSSQDWHIQGDYRNDQCHRQFGRLHEVIRTTGTQRSVQEVFEASGVLQLRRIPKLLCNIPFATEALILAFEDLQMSITLAREELFGMVIDEVIWGQTFAKFSKPVGYSTIGAGGADCPMFRMLDALCGKHDPTAEAALLTELDMRSRHFPPTIRALIHDVASGPSVRALLTSEDASDALRCCFKTTQQLMYELYEMHRKKALRIVLSLRAGQLYTSSGTQKSSSPERHLSNTLKAAMDARFGTNALDRKIPACGHIISPVLDQNGEVTAAKIKFDFEVPIIVGAGDAISVAVDMGGTAAETRIYSITNSHSKESASRLEKGGFVSASSVEICCRNAGAVSSFLCSRRGSFPVQLALRPNPHFRISGNETNHEQTIFIAQNGAAGIFCSWLAQQRAVVGNYLLIVAARQFKMLPHALELKDTLKKLGSQLQVVLCLSQSNEEDFTLESDNVEAFCGRVTDYLDVCVLPSARATYVCGSAEFGLDVARRINSQKTNRKHTLGSRFTPVLTSCMPDLRLHVASSVGTPGEHQKRLRLVSRMELAKHNIPGDIWISLKGIVYDISILPSFHPGGEKTLLCRAGLEADDMFDSVHEGSFEVESILRGLEIGRLLPSCAGSDQRDQCLEKLVQIQNDLTNSTRFEERPTGSPDQLSRAPPVEIVRGSLIQFLASWLVLLDSFSPQQELADALQSAVDAVLASMLKKQQELYEEHFSDLARCARGLQEMYEAHEMHAAKIHLVLDNLKADMTDTAFQSVKKWKLKSATWDIVNNLTKRL